MMRNDRLCPAIDRGLPYDLIVAPLRGLGR